MISDPTTRTLADRLLARFRTVFERDPVILSRAPGRVEVIGNHTDYNGGLVIGAAIDREIVAAIAKRSDRRLRLVSGSGTLVEASLDGLSPRSDDDRWANYPIGVILMLGRAGVPVERGVDLAFESSLPTGAGLSSSAALELATAEAVLRLFDARIDSLELVRTCRRAENEFVGVPSGILDQGVSHFGRRGHVVLVDSRAETFQPHPLPSRARFWIFNSHRKHALVASLYRERFTECMAALEQLGARHPGAVHLTDVTSSDVAAAREMLDPTLFKRALHVTSEHERVRHALQALERGDTDGLGRSLYASHASSRDLFENSTEELDFLVDCLSRRADVIGARLTGGGFGGAVLALTSSGFGEAAAEEVADAYRARFGASVQVLACESADGSGILYTDLLDA